MSDIETTQQERDDAKKIIQKLIILVEKKNKSGNYWNYLVKEKDTNETFIMRTQIKPLDFPFKLNVGDEYMIPMRKHPENKKYGVVDVWLVEDDYNSAFVRYDVPESEVPEEEQAKLETIPAPQIKEYPGVVIETVNDKPYANRHESGTIDRGNSDRNGSQLADEYQGEIIKSPSSLLAYLPPIKEAKEYFNYIQDFKKSILDKSDVLKIGDNIHICRSGWEKFVNVFRLDHKIVSTKKEITKQHLQTFKWNKTVQPWIKIPDRDEWLDGIQYTVIVEMKSLTGSITQGIGLVQQYEGGRDDRKEHDILTHAETRAFNRACSKIIGLGEVSAEEVNG